MNGLGCKVCRIRTVCSLRCCLLSLHKLHAFTIYHIYSSIYILLFFSPQFSSSKFFIFLLQRKINVFCSINKIIFIPFLTFQFSCSPFYFYIYSFSVSFFLTFQFSISSSICIFIYKSLQEHLKLFK